MKEQGKVFLSILILVRVSVAEEHTMFFSWLSQLARVSETKSWRILLKKFYWPTKSWSLTPLEYFAGVMWKPWCTKANEIPRVIDELEQQVCLNVNENVGVSGGRLCQILVFAYKFHT